MRRPDAMMLPGSVSSGQENPLDRMNTVANIARLTITKRPGLDMIYSGKDGHTGMHFVRLDPHESRCYPVGHPLYGSDRHEWFIGEKGADGVYVPVMPIADATECGHVLLGYLKEDPHRVDPDTVRLALAEKVEAYKDSPEYMQMIERFNPPAKEGVSFA